jgi:hypothetical protein
VDKLLAITLTAFQETLRRRVFYVVLLLCLIIVIVISSEMFFVRMARQAGETQILARVAVELMQGILGIWNVAGLFLALFLGASACRRKYPPKRLCTSCRGRWSAGFIFSAAGSAS